MNRIKEELEELAKSVESHCLEVMGDPSLVNEHIQMAIDVGILVDENIIALDGLIDDVEEKYIDEDHVVEEHFGLYTDEKGTEHKVFLSKEVEYRDLVFAYEYTDGFLLFDVTFKLVNYMYSEIGCRAISDREWNIVMETFREVKEEEYCRDDTAEFDEVFDYYRYCDEFDEEEYDYDCFDKPKGER